MSAREGSALHTLAMRLRRDGIVYAVHRRTGDIATHTVRDYVALMADGHLRGHVVRWSMRDAITVQARIDSRAKNN